MIIDMAIWVAGFAAALALLCFIIWRYTIRQQRIAEQERAAYADWWNNGAFISAAMGRSSDLCPICHHSPGIHDNFKHAAHDAQKDQQ